MKTTIFATNLAVIATGVAALPAPVPLTPESLALLRRADHVQADQQTSQDEQAKAQKDFGPFAPSNVLPDYGHNPYWRNPSSWFPSIGNLFANNPYISYGTFFGYEQNQGRKVAPPALRRRANEAQTEQQAPQDAQIQQHNEKDQVAAKQDWAPGFNPYNPYNPYNGADWSNLIPSNFAPFISGGTGINCKDRPDLCNNQPPYLLRRSEQAQSEKQAPQDAQDEQHSAAQNWGLSNLPSGGIYDPSSWFSGGWPWFPSNGINCKDRPDLCNNQPPYLLRRT